MREIEKEGLAEYLQFLISNEAHPEELSVYKILSDGLLRIEYSASEGIILSIEFFPFSGEMPPYVSDCISVIPGLLE